MKKRSLLSVLLLGAVMTVAPVANAQVVQYIGVGSSAMFQAFSVAAFNLAGAGAQHYSVKGNCTSGACAAVNDTARSASIPNEGGNLWVVWDAANTKVWAYLSVDSVVGNRAFFAAPRAHLALDSQLLALAGQNLIPAALLGGTSDQAALPLAIYNALNGKAFTAAMTDIRPEDAKYASDRVCHLLAAGVIGAPGLTLYFPCNPVGTAIQSSFGTGAKATPVLFNISGNDPITSQPVVAATTIPVGAAPIVFLTNRSNAGGLGPVTNITTAQAQQLFSGGCTPLGAGAPNHVRLREPLSGTMNTTEFTVFAAKPSSLAATSQETNVTTNPLSQSCASGQDRKRAIGTGEMVNTAIFSTPASTNADAIGYAFFSFGNVAKIAGSANYAYLDLDGVDPSLSVPLPINHQLPTCTAPCPVADRTSFPTLRNGTYKAWSVLRLVTDASGLANSTALVHAAQDSVNSTVPDFVPFTTSGRNEGLDVYRSHYLQSGIAGVNGPVVNNGLAGETRGGGTEAGGDMGGCIEGPFASGVAPNNVLNCKSFQ